MNQHYLDLHDQLNKANSIALFVHINPDGDCLGSGMALGALLESQGKKISYFSPTPPSEVFSFLPNIQQFSTTFDYDTYDILLFVDIANPQHMLGEFREGHEDYFAQYPKINIDHHISNSVYGDLNIVDATASSVCELLTEIIQDLYPDHITAEIATYLFMGLSTDTGNFIYDKDSKRTFAAASYLLDQGADKASVIKHLYRSKSYDQVKSMGVLLDRMKKEGGVIYSRYTKEDLEEQGVDKEQVEAFLHLLSSIHHDGIFALFKTSSYDLNPTLRCSLRANTDKQDVSKIAGHFNGGGHQAAAGCAVLIEKDRESAMQQMIQKINTLL